MIAGVGSSDYGIVALTETWLTPDCYSGEYFDSSGYAVFRTDRLLKRGGGVLLAVNRELPAHELDLHDLAAGFPSVDMVGAAVSLNTMPLRIILIYVPPSHPAQLMSSLLEAITDLCLSWTGHLIVVGDFNVPEFSSRLSSMAASPASSSRSAVALEDFAISADLRQLNHVTIHLGRSLDLLFSSLPGNVCRSDIPCTNIDPHHPPLSARLCIPGGRRHARLHSAIQMSSASLNFSRRNSPALSARLAAILWDFGNVASPDLMLEQFYENIRAAFEGVVPLKGRPQPGYPAWYTSEIIRSTILKKKLRAKLNKSNSRYHREQYLSIRTSLNKQIRIGRKCYFARVESAIVDNVSSFWKYVNSVKSGANLPAVMYYDGAELTDPMSIANSFSDYFASVFVPAAASNCAYNSWHGSLLGGSISLTRSEVLSSILSLPDKTTMGMDGVPCDLLKEFANELADPLCAIFNRSIQQGQFPTVFKSARICPVHKSGPKTDVTNYRPIAVLSCFSKVSEMCLYSVIYGYFKPEISNAQHGFVPRRSTTTNLVSLTQYVCNMIASGAQVDVIHTDFAKAFDTVCIETLLTKLADLGLPGSLLSLLESYLTGRVNYVRVAGIFSDPYIATSGVPQGSNLGPLLFLIFINLIARSLTCGVSLYADDAKLFACVRSEEDCCQLQANLVAFAEWTAVNRLAINAGKCKVISFSRKLAPLHFDYVVGGVRVPRVRSCTDLGVTFDLRLTFVQHVSKVASAANRVLAFVTRMCRDFPGTRALSLLFNSLVLSKLEYAALVWYPTSAKHKALLERVHRRFLKSVLARKLGHGLPRGVPYMDLCNLNASLTLGERWECSAAAFVAGLARGAIDCPDLLAQINFRVPTFLGRTESPFYLTPTSLSILLHSRLFRLQSSLIPFLRLDDRLDLFLSSSRLPSRYFSNLILGARSTST